MLYKGLTALARPVAARGGRGSCVFPSVAVLCVPRHVRVVAEDVLAQPRSHGRPFGGTRRWELPAEPRCAGTAAQHEEQRLPFRGEMQCGLKYTLLRDNRQTFLVARINFASYFQRRLSITNSEALSFNQKKERKRNWH